MITMIAALVVTAVSAAVFTTLAVAAIIKFSTQ